MSLGGGAATNTPLSSLELSFLLIPSSPHQVDLFPMPWTPPVFHLPVSQADVLLQSTSLHQASALSRSSIRSSISRSSISLCSFSAPVLTLLRFGFLLLPPLALALSFSPSWQLSAG